MSDEQHRFVLERRLDVLLEDVLADVGIDRCQRVVQQVDLSGTRATEYVSTS